jgi:hypothetical protein
MFALAAAMASAVLAAVAGPSTPPRISTPTVIQEASRLLVSVEIETGLGGGVIEQVESGLATTFDYEIELLRDRAHWWDDHLTSALVQVTAMYNAVSRDYLVNIKVNGQLMESHLLRTREEMVRRMTRIERLPAFQASDLTGRGRFLVRARALLSPRTSALLFPSRFATAWRDSAKFRPRRSN